MKKKLFSSLLAQALLSVLVLPAFGQTPWVVSAGVPNFYANAGSFGGNAHLHRTLPNVLWGTFCRNGGLGNAPATLFRSTDNGQTWQSQNVAP